jgi:AcrR family transcriptional regulator
MVDHPAPQQRRRLSSGARRQALLVAAREEFSRRGYYLTQMDHVAAAAGVSKALVYQHFPSKDELFAEVSAQVVDTFAARLPDVVAESENALAAWRGAVRLLVDLVADNPQAWRLVARHLADPELGGVLRGMRERQTEVFARLLADFYSPEPSGPDRAAEDVLRVATLTVQQLIGALQSLLTWWLEYPDVPRAQIEAAAVEFGWLGLDRLRRGEHLDT